MGRVSKKTPHAQLKEEIEEQLISLVEILRNKEEIGHFLGDFLTNEEKTMLGKRVILYMMLQKGYSSKFIHESLSMSYETIRWYKFTFDSKQAFFKKLLEKLIASERNKALWRKVEKALEPVGHFVKARHDMQSRAKLLSGDSST